jgi:hypothetical protein
MEAALTLLPFGLGRVAKGLRGAKAAIGAVRGVEDATKTARTARAATTATEAATRRTIPQTMKDMFVSPPSASRTSNMLQRRGTIAPTSTLDTATEQQALMDLTRRMPSMRGSASTKFQNVDKSISGLADQVDDLFAGVKSTVPGKQFQKSIDAVTKDIVDNNERKRFVIDFRRNVEKAFGKQLPAEMTATNVNTLRRAVNGEMSSIYRKIDAGTSLTDRDHAFLRLKQSLDDQLTQLAPKEIKDQVNLLNRDMNTLMKGRGEFKKASEQGIRLPFNLGSIPGVSPLTQSAGDRAARLLTNTRRITASPAGKFLKQQAGTRFLADATGVRPDYGAPQQDLNAMPMDLNSAFMPGQDAGGMGMGGYDPTGGMGGMDMSGQGGQQQPMDFQTAAGMMFGGGGGGGMGGPSSGLEYSSTDLLNAAMRAYQAGDTKSAAALSDMADQYAKFEAASGKGGGGPNITKVTAQQYGLAQTGATSLQQLAQLLQQDPQVLSRSATPGRQLPIVGGFISNQAGTGEFDAIGYNIADTLIRLRTGAQANESEVRQVQSQIMPRAGDSQATIQRKLQQLQQAFGGVLSLANNSSAGSSLPDDLQMLMSSPQYAY